MKRWLDVTLGIVTSFGGFLEIGSIATAMQAGAEFRYQLVWAIVLGTLCITLLVEMSGRFAAVSHRTIPDAMRERFGLHFFIVPLVLIFVVSLLVLAAEIGGIAVAVEFASGTSFRAWVVPAAVLAWAILWFGNFSIIENVVSTLGLVSLCFAVAAFKLGPNYQTLAAGLAPTLPAHDGPRYWFLAVSILGASISPYLFYFYCSGAIEDKWKAEDLPKNRAIAGLGMGLGGFLSVAVLVVAALVLAPRGLKVNDHPALATLLTVPWSRTGLWLFAATLLITCLGATLEVALALAYMIAQGLGWNWGENLPPDEDARFSLTYTSILVVAMVLVLFGPDPLDLTIFSMALTAATLPVAIVPFLVLMNDRAYLGEHTNGPLGNLAILAISLLAGVIALVSIPLQIVGGKS